jgi:MFS-type transporter involved in bile tolerance (Atg22 family)
MVGKSAAVLGPALMAGFAMLLSEELSILAIPLLLIAGLVIMFRVQDP